MIFRRLAQLAPAALVSLGLVATVTGAIFGLRLVAPVLSLGVLYLFAVLPVAALWGLRFALPVSVVSMLAFNFFFLEPRHTLQLADSENWVALAVYLATAVSVSGLAASARNRAAEAEQRRREAEESEERRRSEAIETEALRRSDAVKTAILRSVSHDLRSPITAIMTAGEVLHGETVSADERDELLASIRMQVRRLERSVSNLLDLSRLEAGAAKPVPGLWTIDSLIAQALEDLGPDGDRVDVELPPESPPVLVDPTQLEHALVNLFENALKFSSAAARIFVSAEVSDEHVVVRVADTGPGIPPTDQERIFEAFNRGVNGAGERGTGLGLSIARGFVQVNGGRIWVESSLGVGSVFVVALPVSEPLPVRVPA